MSDGTRTERCSFGSLFLSMVCQCRDSATWELFILFTIWTKYNSLRGGKKESRNRTDSFERANRSTNALPRPFFTTIDDPTTTTHLFFWTIILHTFLPSHIRLHSVSASNFDLLNFDLSAFTLPLAFLRYFFLSIVSPSLLSIKIRNG